MGPSRLPRRATCVSLAAATVRAVRAAAASVPDHVDFLELRADLLDPEAFTEEPWNELPQLTRQPWVYTWRSPAEGGGGRPRPTGALTAALNAGFAYVDVEAVAVAGSDDEAAAVPPERRWVSAHSTAAPRTAEELTEAWQRTQRTPGALHKLVTLADRFVVNAWTVALAETAAKHETPATVFAQGWPGHVSRVLGFLAGNTMTFLAGDEGATAEGQVDARTWFERYRLDRLSSSASVYGVLGNRVRSSRSPELHNAAFARLGLDAVYLPLESEDAAPVLSWMREGRVSGLSVTVPHKETVYALVDRRDAEAEAVGAVNTVWREGRELVGGNTDVLAAAAFLHTHASPTSAVLVAGAGGAARAAVTAAVRRGHPVTVFNRSEVRGRKLAEDFGVEFGGDLDAVPAQSEAVMINAAIGGDAPLPESWARADWSRRAVLDLGYAHRPTALAGAVRAQEGRFMDGHEFLRIQAEGQFSRWTGRPWPSSEDTPS